MPLLNPLTPARPLLYTALLLSFLAFTPATSRASQCTTPAGAGSGDGSVATVTDSSARGTFFSADCSGAIYSISFHLTDPGLATRAYVQVYEGRPSEGTLRLLAQEPFTPVVGLNTVVIASQPNLTATRIYSLTVFGADSPIEVEALSTGTQALECPTHPVPNTCLEKNEGEVPFSIALTVPELQMVDDLLEFASDDAHPAGTGRDLGEKPVGERAETTITLRNDGTRILSVSSISFSDVGLPAASMFSVEPSSFWVAVGGQQDVTVFFTPSDGGLRTAEMNIVSDDSDEPVTSFHVVGTGLADFGDAPGAQSLSASDGARHVAAGPILGRVRDIEGEGGAGLAADADDDGVMFSVTADAWIAGSTPSVSVYVTGGPAYLQVFMDHGDGSASGAPNGRFDSGLFTPLAADEWVVSNLPVTSGQNHVSIPVPAAAVGSAALRFRLTTQPSTVVEPLGPDGFAADGEVEDYRVELVQGPASTQAHVSDGSLTVAGGRIELLDAFGNAVLSVPTALLAGSVLEVTSDSTGNALTVDTDVLASLHTHGAALEWGADNGFDSIVLQASGPVDGLAYAIRGSGEGAVTLTAAGSDREVLRFDGVEHIDEAVSAQSKRFTSEVPSETIVLSATEDGGTGNGISLLRSGVGGIELVFANPTRSLDVEATHSSGGLVWLGRLDAPLDAGFTGINAYGGLGPDVFVVTPSTEYGIEVSGSDPAVCPGDALVPYLSSSSAQPIVAGTQVTFPSGERPVSFSGIEGVGEADLSLRASHETLYATQDLLDASGNGLVLTVTNDGAFEASCVSVVFEDALSNWIDGFQADPSNGSIDASGAVWEVGPLGPGQSATIEITGFISPEQEASLRLAVSSGQDIAAWNDHSDLELSHGFAFPVQTQVNAALLFTRDVTGGSHEATVLGLFQGAPGHPGAVWCNIPGAAPGTSWPPATAGADVGSKFRPCADGLPYPLHVNDLLRTASGTLWMGTWGHHALYRSTDGGETWQPTTVQGGASIVYAIASDPVHDILYGSADNGTVIRSLNGGATWQRSGSLPGVASNTPWSLAAHPDVPGFVYAGTRGNGVFVSSDYGHTWRTLDGHAGQAQALIASGAGQVFDMEFAPDLHLGVRRLVVGTGKGAWRVALSSSDPAEISGPWEPLGPEIALDNGSVVVPEVRSIAFLDDGALSSDDDLVAGTWGFGVYQWSTPLSSAHAAPLTLRGSQVTFVTTSRSGLVMAGSSEGALSLVQVGSSSATATDPQPGFESPDGYALKQNYPNPFNPQTTIGFDAPATGHVTLTVHDALGRRVATLVDGVISAGSHQVLFDATDLPSGAYLYRLAGPGEVHSRVLILQK